MRATLPVLLLCLCCAAISEGQRRRIETLPRLNFRPDFRQYSGYLRSTQGRRLFYWLVESSEARPADAPLVLWLNGGPGCSSVGGLLMTNGPFLANDRAELDRNEMAWNRIANMLYIDSPNGVGLSEPGPLTSSVLNDEDTTMLNLNALQHFFSLFPEYVGRPFYIAGESYAGTYIPLLAQAIRDGPFFRWGINLRGIAVGNGLHVQGSHPSLRDSRKYMFDLMGIPSSAEGRVWMNGLCEIINCYNIAKPCHRQGSSGVYPCLNSTGLVAYLNDNEVRRALGVEEWVSAAYQICSDSVTHFYRTSETGVFDVLAELAANNVSVLLYHGTLDLLIPANVTQTLIRQLPHVSDSPWYYRANDSGRVSSQIGGVQSEYMGGALKYRTVVGAGHSVATDRPEMGFQIFADFLGVRL